MNDVIFNDIVEQVENAYANLFLIAIDRKYSLTEIVDDVAKRINNWSISQDESKKSIPQGFEGVVFISAVSKMLGINIYEIFSMSLKEKQQIVYSIIHAIDIAKETAIEYDEEEDYTTFTCLYYAEGEDKENDIYKLRFWRTNNESGEYVYSVESYFKTGGLTMEGETDFIYNTAIIWTEEDGDVADFIENVIEKVELEEEQREFDEDIADEDGDNDLDSLSETHEDLKTMKDDRITIRHERIDEVDEKTGRKVIDELVAYVYSDTQSIKLLDKFEGFGEDEPVYKRIVIGNTMYHWDLNLIRNAGVNLVIERSRSRDYVGDITFTEFKTGKDKGLRDYIKKEITNEIAEKYFDKDEFYRFSKPYRLRAQNSGNRTGYGWEWDWSGGYGDYIEGTLYGETTDYVFAGAYISSVLARYEWEKREPFNINNLKERETGCNINRYPVEFVTYVGRLSDGIRVKTEQRFIKVEKNDRVRHLPVAYDANEKKIYIERNVYLKYKKKLHGKINLVKSVEE